MNGVAVSQNLENLAGLFLKSARQDGFKFLNIGDVQWQAEASKLNAGLAPVEKLPKPFAEDPFAQFALWSGNVKELSVAAGTEKHFFETRASGSVESSASEKQVSDFSSTLLTVNVEENARTELVYFHQGGGQLFSRIYVRLAKNAHLKLTVIQSGVQKGQVRAHVDCLGEGAEALIHGLTVGKSIERQDFWVDVIHSVPHTRSDLVAWCVVKDQAHSVFNGRMTIEQTAPFTEAFQKNKNLILSERASVDTFPKLFIWNNEVKCAHGSSVSSLEPDQLIYLQSRGIDRGSAEVMLQKGFIRQAIEWIGSPQTRGQVESALLGQSENEESNDEKEWGQA